MKIFAIYLRIKLTSKPKWFDGLRNKYPGTSILHITLIQPRHIDESQIEDIKNKINVVLSEATFSAEDRELVFDGIELEKRADNTYLFMWFLKYNKSIENLQKKLLDELSDYNNYCEEVAKEYETNFRPHMTVADHVETKEEIEKILSKDAACKGLISDLVFVAVKDRTLEESENPNNFTIYGVLQKDMKTTETSHKEIPIQEIGSYFKVDEEGFLVNPASPQKIGNEWKPVVDDIVQAYRSHLGENLHSVYVRGSVAKGNAVLGISDIDTFAYANLPKDQIKIDWIGDFEKDLKQKYPFVQGFEINIDPIEDAPNDRIMLLQSACVFGEDVSKKMPKIKPGKEMLDNVYSFSANLAWFDQWSQEPHEKEEVINSCRWLMKRFLRTGFELTMERAGLYTRDLYPSYKTFVEYYPDKEAEMKKALYLAINPTDDMEAIKKIRNGLGVWLDGQAVLYKK